MLDLISISSRERTNLLAYPKRQPERTIRFQSRLKTAHGSGLVQPFWVESHWVNNRSSLLARWFASLLTARK